MSGKQQKTVRVFLRVRPPVRQELERKDVLDCISVQPHDPTTCLVKNPKAKSDGEAEVKEHRFHRCFDQDSTQDEVYERIARDTIDDVFDGYHGLIFVYGQTGTGKTYTLCCQEEGKEGILYNSVVEIFARIQQDAHHEYECSLQFVQIYNEIIQDLLSPSKSSVVQLRDDPENDGAVYLPGCNVVPVSTAGECLKYYLQGDKRRATGETLMNYSSSRSHTVFMLDVYKRPRMTKEDVDRPDAPRGNVRQGRLILVDLAGSEKVKKTASEGVRLVEANSINGSLLVLGRVVNALIDGKQSHVPYRESKLTRLLQYPLSGMGKTSIVVTVSPSMYNYDETMAAVLFGQRAMKLKVNAKVHEKVDWKALALKLQAMMEGGMDCVRSETIEEQRLDYEKQVQAYKEQVECLERRLEGVETRDTQLLAEENHALRELVRALQGKLIKLDDRRKMEKKDKKALQQSYDQEVEKNLKAQIAQKEAEHKLKQTENELLEAQNQLIVLSGELRRMHREAVKAGLPGCNPNLLAPLTAQPRDSTNSPSGFIDLVDEDSGDEGTLEVGKGFAEWQADMEFKVDTEAYGDTAEQLSQALQQVRLLKLDRKRLANEGRITSLSNRKYLCKIQDLEGQVKRWSELCQEQGEQLRSREKEFQHLEAQRRKSVAETEEQEKERYVMLISKMTEYEARMDKYRSQMQRATNEARIEANAKGKLQTKVCLLEEEKAQSVEQTRHLEHQIEELTQRLALRHLADHDLLSGHDTSPPPLSPTS
eukprot:GGOE01043821.1.p1 GENE.GGOE01043821.1~~GGOE01043821.1.p1  ORF type:complete len:773 (+),score=300.45 GGOE01043821.1:29-2320(+)